MQCEVDYCVLDYNKMLMLYKEVNESAQVNKIYCILRYYDNARSRMCYTHAHAHTDRNGSRTFFTAPKKMKIFSKELEKKMIKY